MPAPTKHKSEAWREKAEKTIKMREWIKKREIELAKKQAKETGKITLKAIGDPKSNMPIIGSKKYPWSSKQGKVLAEDYGPKGEVILKDGKWIPIVEALRGTLVKKGIKLAYRLATKKYPELFKKKRISIKELKTKKIRKTPELAPVGIAKLQPNDLRKLAVAEVTKDRLQKLGNMAIKHQRKAVSLFWGKAKNFNQIKKLEKYHNLATKKKLESFGKQYAELSKYQETIKAKSATKHSEGGEVTIKNVDKDLL